MSEKKNDFLSRRHQASSRAQTLGAVQVVAYQRTNARVPARLCLTGKTTSTAVTLPIEGPCPQCVLTREHLALFAPYRSSRKEDPEGSGLSYSPDPTCFHNYCTDAKPPR